jgi:hypothetical protein
VQHQQRQVAWKPSAYLAFEHQGKASWQLPLPHFVHDRAGSQWATTCSVMALEILNIPGLRTLPEPRPLELPNRIANRTCQANLTQLREVSHCGVQIYVVLSRGLAVYWTHSILKLLTQCGTGLPSQERIKSTMATKLPQLSSRPVISSSHGVKCEMRLTVDPV